MSLALCATALLVMGSIVAGCDDSPAAPSAASIAGTWDAVFQGVVQGTGTTQTDDLTINLSQSGSTIGGFLRFSPRFEAIDIPLTTGRLVGRELTYSAATTRQGCEFQVEAELTLDPSGTRIEGSQTQSNCEGTAVGRVTATKRR